MRELYKHELDISDVLEVLENGYDCPKGRRAAGTLERCLEKKQKELRVVVVKSYDYHLDTDAWIITHVGMTSKRKVKK